jgi:hypothetical protein
MADTPEEEIPPPPSLEEEMAETRRVEEFLERMRGVDPRSQQDTWEAYMRDKYPYAWKVAQERKGILREESVQERKEISREESVQERKEISRKESDSDELLSPFERRFKKILYNALAEGANTLFFILLLAGARWLVEHLFGQGKLFDYVPVRYLFDIGDIAVIGRFIWNTLKGGE